MNASLLGHAALVCAGLAGLWKMGDLVVHYTLATARAFKVTAFFIGFVILALAADVPELAVAIMAAFRGISEVAAGDIIGANFSDVAFVIGIVLLIAGTVTLDEIESKRLVYVLTLTSCILLAIFAIGHLYPIHGFILIGIYVVTLIGVWYQTRHEHAENSQEAIGIEAEHTLIANGNSMKIGSIIISERWMLLGKLALSIAGIMGISYVTLTAALELATILALPLETVGATIFGVGTSLPELALSLSALKRKEFGLALGTTLGTVLEQTTLVLGTLTVLSPKPVDMNGLWGSSLFMFLAFIIISHGLYRYSRVGRSTGVALVTLFFAYLAYQVVQSGAV